MKRILLFLSLVAATVIVSFAVSCKEPDSKDGIHFFEGNFEAALAKAKAEQKPIFIDIYATWCGPCKMLKRKTFPEKEVGTYFNANYISMSFDGENGEGIVLAEKFHITGYPTLIVLDKDGTLVNMQTGYLPPDDFLAWGKQWNKK